MVTGEKSDQCIILDLSEVMKVWYNIIMIKRW